MHWKRWRANGDPTVSRAGEQPSPEKRFAGQLERRGGCLVWTGSYCGSGYGQIRVDGKRIKVHRYAWERVNGPVPQGMEIDHICHNRKCVDVCHLRLATREQNVSNRDGARRDSSTRIRNVKPNGRGYAVQVQSNGERHYYGTYPTVEEASAVASKARLELFGEFAGRGTR